MHLGALRWKAAWPWRSLANITTLRCCPFGLVVWPAIVALPALLGDWATEATLMAPLLLLQLHLVPGITSR